MDGMVYVEYGYVSWKFDRCLLDIAISSYKMSEKVIVFSDIN